MKDPCFFSIITPVFNLIEGKREKRLFEALDSIHNQSFKNFEHIVVDGNSTDGTVALLNGLMSDKYKFKFISEPDTSVYDAMNKGVALSSGQYILFLNSDDYYHDLTCLQKIHDFIGNDQIDYIITPINTVTSKNSKPIRVRLWRIFLNMPFGHPGLIVSRIFFDSLHGFDKKFRIAGDYDFSIRALLAQSRNKKFDYSFVTFRQGGLSSNRDVIADEKRIIWQKNFGKYGLSNDDCDYMLRTRRLPILIAFKIFADKYLPLRIRFYALRHILLP